LDYFQLKDIHQHIQENPFIGKEKKNSENKTKLWQLLRAQGWKGEKAPNRQDQNAIRAPFTYPKALEYVSQLTPGFHSFNLFDLLVTYLARYKDFIFVIESVRCLIFLYLF
jgi:hypothetical protein